MYNLSLAQRLVLMFFMAVSHVALGAVLYPLGVSDLSDRIAGPGDVIAGGGLGFAWFVAVCVWEYIKNKTRPPY